MNSGLSLNTDNKILQTDIESCKIESNLVKGGEKYETMRSPDG